MQPRAGISASEIIQAFWTHLHSTHGAASRTCDHYTNHAERFLQWKYKDEPIEPSTITAMDLMVFTSQFASCHKPKTSKLLTTALRSFLRFLQLQGHSVERLVGAVPTVPARKLSHLPVSLSDEQLQRLLGVFDGATPCWLRDRAIAQCLAGLGLRAGEAAQLTLEDIDWRTGVVRIRQSKERRVDLLPLPKIVGQAIVDYLRDGRPQTDERRIFVRHHPPAGAAIRTSTIGAMLRRAFTRAKLDLPSKGSHVLRHTLGARLVQAGASIKHIADVLRHQHIDTTMIYTKVNLPLLREVAMPWPEVKR